VPTITAKSLLLFTALPAALLAAAGCERHFRLQFINETAQAGDLVLTVPGHGTIGLGQIAGGGKLTYKLGMKAEYLPARCWWHCGGLSGNFVLVDQGQDTIVVPIRRPGERSRPSSRPASRPGRAEGSD